MTSKIKYNAMSSRNSCLNLNLHRNNGDGKNHGLNFLFLIIDYLTADYRQPCHCVLGYNFNVFYFHIYKFTEMYFNYNLVFRLRDVKIID